MCQPIPTVSKPDARRRDQGLTKAEMHVARRLLLQLYAAYYPCLYFKNAENMAVS